MRRKGAFSDMTVWRRTGSDDTLAPTVYTTKGEAMLLSIDITLKRAMPWPRRVVGKTCTRLDGTPGSAHLHSELEASVHGVGSKEPAHHGQDCLPHQVSLGRIP